MVLPIVRVITGSKIRSDRRSVDAVRRSGYAPVELTWTKRRAPVVCIAPTMLRDAHRVGVDGAGAERHTQGGHHGIGVRARRSTSDEAFAHVGADDRQQRISRTGNRRDAA